MQEYSYEEKLAALRQAMREKGLGGLLLYSSGQLSMLEVNAVRWLSGVLPMGPNTGILVPAVEDPRLVIGLPWDEGRVRDASSIEDLRVGENFVAAVGDGIRDKKVAGKIGILGWAFMPASVFLGLESIDGVSFESGDTILSALSSKPGSGGLAALKRAATMADVGFLALLERAQVGMYEYELSAEVEYAMRAMGSEDNFGMVTASDHNHCTHPPQDRKITEGDIIIAEITPAVGGQFVQLCRTAVVGPVSPLLREKFDIMEEAMEKSLAAVRPGNKVGDVSRAMNQVFAAHGYADYCKPPYIRVRGHGLGFMSLPFSEMIDENETIIEEGMDFVVHPNQYIPETGYLMLGDTVWVEAQGYQRLTETPMQLFTIGG